MIKKFFPLIITVLLTIIVLSFLNRSELWRAHRTNEKGIDQYRLKNYSSAEKEFTKSITFKIREEIPLFNLANSYQKAKSYSKAHEYYDKAISVKADYPDVYYNDALNFYYWALSELDTNYCSIERPLSLLNEAQKQLKMCVEFAGEKSRLGIQSSELVEFIGKQALTIEEKHKQNEELCKSQQQQNEQGSDQNQDNDEDQKNQSQQADPSENDESNQKDNEDQQDEKGPQDNKKENKKDNTSQGGSTESNPSITDEEKQEIDAALERITEESSENYYNQTREGQIRPEDESQVDRKILW